ncbi:MAG: succinate dehydrogenase assembly factor 2 [Pseudomonadota bacterium]
MNDTEKEIRLKRLKYRANHRGIKEMDIILGGFADQYLSSLSDIEVDDFEALMAEHDRDLIVWFTGEQAFPHDDLRSIFDLINSRIAKV